MSREGRKPYSSEEKIWIVLDGLWIVLDGLRCEDSIAERRRREGGSQGINYKWSKGFTEAGEKRLAAATARASNTC